MKVAAFFAIAITAFMIVFRFLKERSVKRLSIALLTLVWLLAAGYFALTLRPLILLYILHLLFVGVAWISLLWYIWSGKYLWWFKLLPLATLSLFWLLAWFEGQRFEA